MKKRVILIVLDSVGIGHAPDAAEYGDEGSNTILSVSKSPEFSMDNMKRMGYFNIEKVEVEGTSDPTGTYARLIEKSKGKDTTTGHWEMAGLVSERPFPTYPEGFPGELLEEFSRRTGRRVLCNLPYSGTEVIEDYGREHMETGALIVYTSADSVFQIAAHEEVIPVETLYEYCRIARELLQGEHGVGRVIARPFIGTPGHFTRTVRRHDFSLEPPADTVMDKMKRAGYDVLAVGKIYDIFAGRGTTDFIRTEGNADGIEKTIEWMSRDFNGLMFVNLVDTDMIYGHRRDVDGYAGALAYFDRQLPRITELMRDDDILMITADHGCDPAYTGTDHTRESVPLLMYGNRVPAGSDYGTIEGFDVVSNTILKYFGLPEDSSAHGGLI